MGVAKSASLEETPYGVPAGNVHATIEVFAGAS